MKKASIFIILIGSGLTIFTPFTYFIKEKVAAIVDVEITRNEPHQLNWSLPINIALKDIGEVVF